MAKRLGIWHLTLITYRKFLQSPSQLNTKESAGGILCAKLQILVAGHSVRTLRMLSKYC